MKAPWAVLCLSCFASCLDSRSLSQFGCAADTTCQAPDGSGNDGGLVVDDADAGDCRGPAAMPIGSCEIAQMSDAGTCQVVKRQNFVECSSEPGQDRQCFDGVCRPRFQNSVLGEPIDSALSTVEVRVPVNCTLIVDTGDLKSSAPPVISTNPSGCVASPPTLSVKPYLALADRFVAVLLAKRLVVDGTVRVIGRRPLSVVVEQDVSISKEGVLDANALPGAPNAGNRDAEVCSVKDGLSTSLVASGGEPPLGQQVEAVDPPAPAQTWCLRPRVRASR
jgi:hypothetical protein